MHEEHPNLSLVRRLWDAGASGDADAICDLYAPDAVMLAHGAPGSGLTGEFKGIAEILDGLARAGENVDDSSSELLETYASDSGAVIRCRTLATRGGKHLDMQYVLLLAIEQQRIVRSELIPIDQQRNDEFWRSQ
jgi:ketosteroid isomerase-like protein